MTPEHFRFEQRGRVGIITLDRAEKLNALTFASYEELRDFFVYLNGREDIGALVLNGAGRAFCAGGDVDDIIGQLFSRGQVVQFTR